MTRGKKEGFAKVSVFDYFATDGIFIKTKMGSSLNHFPSLIRIP
jgi:hypothetical protein